MPKLKMALDRRYLRELLGFLGKVKGPKARAEALMTMPPQDRRAALAGISEQERLSALEAMSAEDLTDSIESMRSDDRVLAMVGLKPQTAIMALQCMGAELLAAVLSTMPAEHQQTSVLSLKPADVALALAVMEPAEQGALLASVDPKVQAKVLFAAEPTLREAVFSSLSPDATAAVIVAMDQLDGDSRTVRYDDDSPTSGLEQLTMMTLVVRLIVLAAMPIAHRAMMIAEMEADHRNEALNAMLADDTAAVLVLMPAESRERALVSMTAERRADLKGRMKFNGTEQIMWSLQCVLIEMISGRVGGCVKIWWSGVVRWRALVSKEAEGQGTVSSSLSEMNPEQVLGYFGALSMYQAKGMLRALSRRHQHLVLSLMPSEQRHTMLVALSANDQAAVLQAIPVEQANAALATLNKKDLLAVLLAMSPAHRATCLISGSLTTCTNAFMYMTHKQKGITLGAMSPKDSAAALTNMSKHDRMLVISAMAPEERDASLAAMSSALRVASLADMYVAYGIQSVGAGDCDAAEAHLRKAIEIDHRHPLAWSHYINVFKFHCVKASAMISAGGSNGLNVKLVRARAVREWSKHLDTHYDSGMKRTMEPALQAGALCVRGMDRANNTAKRLFESAMDIDPTHPIPYFLLGAYMGEQLKNTNAELRLYKKALMLEPKLGAAYVNLGNLLRATRNDLEVTTKLCKHVVEIDPACASALCTLADMNTMRRSSNKAQREFDIEASVRLYEAALKVDPRCTVAHRNLGSLMLKGTKNLPAAREYLTRASELGDEQAKKLLIELAVQSDELSKRKIQPSRPGSKSGFTPGKMRRKSMQISSIMKMSAAAKDNEDPKAKSKKSSKKKSKKLQEDIAAILDSPDMPPWKTAGTQAAWDSVSLVPDRPMHNYINRISTPVETALHSLHQAKAEFDHMVAEPMRNIIKNLNPPQALRSGGRSARVKDLVELLPGLNMVEVALSDRVHHMPKPPATTREAHIPRRPHSNHLKQGAQTHRDTGNTDRELEIRNKFALDFTVETLQDDLGGVITRLTEQLGGYVQPSRLNKHSVIPAIPAKRVRRLSIALDRGLNMEPVASWRWGQPLSPGMLVGDNPSMMLDSMRNLLIKPSCTIEEIHRRGVTLIQMKDLETLVKQVLAEVVVRDISTNSAVYGARIVWDNLVPPPKMDGKSAKQQQDVGPLVRPTMYHICDHFVKRLTDRLECSFVELIASKQQTPKWFVSHAYSTSFEETLVMLRYHAEVHELSPGASYWIDTFARNLSVREEPMQPLHRTTLWNAIRKCKGLVQVMDDECKPHQRSWCIIETYVATVMQGKSFEVLAMAQDQKLNQTQQLTRTNSQSNRRRESVQPKRYPALRDRSGQEHCKNEDLPFPSSVYQKGLQVSIATSQALLKQDRENILRLVADVDEPGMPPPVICPGYDRVNWGVQRLFCGPALISFAHSNKVARISQLLQESPENVMDHMDEHGVTAVSIAASKGNEPLMRVLVEASANLDVRNHEGKTPVCIAAESNHNAIVRLLARSGANLDIQRDDCSTPLHVAAELGHTEVVCSLAEHKADLNQPAADGSTPIYIAMCKQKMEVVQALINYGAVRPTRQQLEFIAGEEAAREKVHELETEVETEVEQIDFSRVNSFSEVENHLVRTRSLDVGTTVDPSTILKE